MYFACVGEWLKTAMVQSGAEVARLGGCHRYYCSRDAAVNNIAMLSLSTHRTHLTNMIQSLFINQLCTIG